MPEIQTPTPGQSARTTRRARPVSVFATVMLGVLFLALIVAVIFAANTNEVVGWIVVIVTGLWFLLTAVVLLTLRSGARAIGRRWDRTNANLAARGGNGPAPAQIIGEDELNHEMKLDHSFKIVQVQQGVIVENLRAGTPEAADQIERALETIEITASNARDMIKQRRRDRHTTQVDGEIID